MLRLIFYAKYHVYPCGTNMTQNHPGPLKDPNIFMSLENLRIHSGIIIVPIVLCPFICHY
jgi:hypothetical protein